MSDRLERLGRFCARHHRYVILAWVVIVVGAIAANAVAGGEESNTFTLRGTQSQEASDALQEKFPTAAATSAKVYIIIRIQEEYESDGDAARAVRDGLGSAARMVIAAATIMFFVFFAFVLRPSIVMKMFGLGLAVAILIDAFIARMVLLPAVLRLIGRAAWWPGGRPRR